MPFVRVAVGRSVLTDPGPIGESIHSALVETLGVPEGDHFQVHSRHDTDEIVYDRSFLGLERTDRIVFIQITLATGRDVNQKKILYKGIAERLAAECEIRPADVFITLLEVPPENFSFGEGLAQFADQRPPHLASRG